MTNAAAHPALLASHLATTFSAATTGHALSCTSFDYLDIRGNNALGEA
jgi:hypothetical protein